ncbi:MAG: right-handed parallel beta-helix repeat-containing protein, partial [Planctomycetota bacterium]
MAAAEPDHYDVDVSDAADVSEALTLELPELVVAVDDDLSVTESLTMELPELVVAVDDDVAVSESLSLSIPSAASVDVNVSDVINVSESVTEELPELVVAVDDDITVSEYISVSSGVANYYVDPDAADDTGDGSIGDPWRTLEWVVDNKINVASPTVLGGDNVWLYTGYHGDIDWRTDDVRSNYITIDKQPGESPTLRRVYLDDVSYVKFRNLDVSPSNGGVGYESDIFEMEDNSGDCHHLMVENCTIYSDTTAVAYTWTEAQWAANAGNGIYQRGHDVEIRDCTVFNVAHGISIENDDCTVENNYVYNVSHDGGRANGSRVIWQDNIVENFIDLSGYDGRHHDILQSTGPV